MWADRPLQRFAMLARLLLPLLLLSGGGPKAVLALLVRGTGPAKRGKLAVAISGGLRGFEECAASLVESFVKPNLEHFDQVDLFVATWDDRTCVPPANVSLDQQPSVELIQKVYARAGIQIEAKNVWLGDHRRFHFGYQHHSPDGVWPYNYKQAMMNNAEDMWLLWQATMSMVGSDHDVVVRTRPDMCFDPGWKLQFQKQKGQWTAMVAATQAKHAMGGWPEDRDQLLEIPLEPNLVYMGANDFHEDSRDHVPDDMTGFGLYQPMEGTFGTTAIHVNKGMFNVTDEEYQQLWGQPVVETGSDLRDSPVALLNPPGSFVRERYPEKLLKHQILESGYRYALIEDPRYSPYRVSSPRRSCPSEGQVPQQDTAK